MGAGYGEEGAVALPEVPSRDTGRWNQQLEAHLNSIFDCDYVPEKRALQMALTWTCFQLLLQVQEWDRLCNNVRSATKAPLTDAELTKLAETRPIRVLFIGDRNFSTISKEQFMIYAQSCLNLVNAGFANINIKLKMTVYDTYVMNEEQDRTHLLEVPGRNLPSVYAHKTMNILQRTVIQYPGVNESDMVFVLTRKILLDEKNHTLLSHFHWHIGPCGGRLKPILYFDAPFSYAATRDMWFTILAGIAKSVLCKTNSLALCYKQLIPAYKDDLNSSLCLTTTGTQKAPTFSGIVGFDVDKYCDTVAAQFGLESGRKENVSRHCNPPCLRGYSKHAPYLYPCQLSHAVSTQGIVNTT
ncbi:uncharacterized protein LOC135394646 [Ornithodoros turicata]|uniref:uncharacterized protein LOC135394646 n=1 Tax=Ornithodoros turicata TaxID=34597 RepID=UPI0031393205